MKKKILSVLLALGLLVSLTACGSKDTAADNAGGDTGYADSINILVYPTMCLRMCWPPLSRSTASR